MKREINHALMRAAIDAYRERQIDRKSALEALVRAGVAPAAAEQLIRAAEPARQAAVS